MLTFPVVYADLRLFELYPEELKKLSAAKPIFEYSGQYTLPPPHDTTHPTQLLFNTSYHIGSRIFVAEECALIQDVKIG